MSNWIGLAGPFEEWHAQHLRHQLRRPGGSLETFPNFQNQVDKESNPVGRSLRDSTLQLHLFRQQDPGQDRS